jgi:hypothetical protein
VRLFSSQNKHRYGMAEDIAGGRTAGFVRHLTKPIRFDRLSAAMAEMG